MSIKQRKSPLSFSEAADDYLTKLAQEDGKDLKMKSYRLKMHLKPFFGDVRLSKISSSDVEQYKRQRASELVMRPNGPGGKPVFGGETKPATINRELATLSHLFSKAVEWKWIDHKPATIKRLKEGSGRIVYLTVEQMTALLKAAEGDQKRQIHPFIKIGLETSMRKSEILAIRRQDVDLQRMVIYIPKAKAGAREQPITTGLAEYLASYMVSLQPGDQWLFPSPAAKAGRTINLDKPFRRCVQSAGLDVKQVVRHTLRHTAITHLVQAGVDLPTVKRISGHKTLSMVEKYSHQNGEHIQIAMSKLTDRYNAIAS
jgi:integrase